MIDAWADRINPIVVRDVRQGLRSKTFVATFAFLLGACLIGALVAASEAEGHDAGEPLFYTYTGFLYFVGCLLQPMGAFRAFAREREGEVWAPLVLSGLRARAILRGKIASQLVQGVLFASSIVPFLAFAYLLGGVSIIGMAIWLVGAFAAQSLLTTVAIAGATFSDTKRNRWASQAAAGLFLWMGLGWGVGGLSLMGSSLVSGGSPVLTVVCSLLVWATLLGLVFEVAAAKLMAWGEDYVTGPRLALAAHLVCVVALGAALASDATGVAIAYSMLMLGLFGFHGATDLPPPAGRWLQERRWMALRPGPLTAFGLFAVGQGLLVLVAAAIDAKGVHALVGVAATAISILSLGVLLLRGLGPTLPAQAVRVSVAAVALVWFMVGANAESDSALKLFLVPFDASDLDPMWPSIVFALVTASIAFSVLWKVEAGAAERRRG